MIHCSIEIIKSQELCDLVKFRRFKGEHKMEDIIDKWNEFIIKEGNSREFPMIIKAIQSLMVRKDVKKIKIQIEKVITKAGNIDFETKVENEQGVPREKKVLKSRDGNPWNDK
jgi:hypothetical protein